MIIAILRNVPLILLTDNFFSVELKILVKTMVAHAVVIEIYNVIIGKKGINRLS